MSEVPARMHTIIATKTGNMLLQKNELQTLPEPIDVDVRDTKHAVHNHEVDDSQQTAMVDLDGNKRGMRDLGDLQECAMCCQTI